MPNKPKTFVEVQHIPVDKDGNDKVDDLKGKSLDEVADKEQLIDEVRTEIKADYQKAKILAIGSGNTVLDLKVGDYVLVKLGVGDDFQWFKGAKIMMKHQIVAKIS